MVLTVNTQSQNNWTQITHGQKVLTESRFFKFLQKAKFWKLDSHIWQVMRIDNSKFAKSKFLSFNEIPGKLKHHCKKTRFLRHIILSDFSLIPHCLKRKYLEKNIFDYFVNGILVYSEGKIFVIQRSLVNKFFWEVGLLQISVYGKEGFMKMFGVYDLENLFAGEIEMNCI